MGTKRIHSEEQAFLNKNLYHDAMMMSQHMSTVVEGGQVACCCLVKRFIFSNTEPCHFIYCDTNDLYCIKLLRSACKNLQIIPKDLKLSFKCPQSAMQYSLLVRYRDSTFFSCTKVSLTRR